MSIIHIQPKQPVAYIVYIPDRELIQSDPLKVEKTLRSLEDGVKDTMLPYAENPKNALSRYTVFV